MIFRLSDVDSDCVEVVSGTPEKPSSTSDNGIKKKRKKKHKHKKHSSEKGSKKHKKHKRKRSHSLTSETEIKQPKIIEKGITTPEMSDKSARYTPEPKITNINVTNGKLHIEKKETETVLSTETNAVVEYITKDLDKEHSLEIVSSESDAPVVEDCDSEDIDVAVIEDDMNLEELMKQKELLQARLGQYLSDASIETPIDKKQPKKVEPSNEIILLDDSSNDSFEARNQTINRNRKIVLSKKVEKRDLRKRSRSYERKSPERRRDDYKKLQRDKHRKPYERYKRDRTRSRSRDRLRHDRMMERSRDRPRSRDRRSRDRDRARSIDRRDRDRMDRHRRMRDDRDRNREKKEGQDKFKDSLSEGLGKVSSDSDIDVNIDIQEEEDEEQIIERRRKQREELLKVRLLHIVYQ